MDKRLDLNKNNINIEFREFFSKRGGIDFLIDDLSLNFDVYLFSGVIRDYFLNYPNKFRDIDLVVKPISSLTLDEKMGLFKSFNIFKNSFGGYKVEINGQHIDLWELNETWALKNRLMGNKLFLDASELLGTPFFNFSAIIFDFKLNQFSYSNDFLLFLKKRELDLVLKINPLPQLCVINTIFYKLKFNLAISKNLKQYCIEYFGKYNKNDFENIQLKHFGEIKYEYSYIKVFIDIFKEDLINSS